MRLTTRERRFRALLYVWLFLFGAGFLVFTVGLGLDFAQPIYLAEPLLVFAWLGQGILLLCTWLVLGGVRDNEHAAQPKYLGSHVGTERRGRPPHV